jgi:hypothetical protein
MCGVGVLGSLRCAKRRWFTSQSNHFFVAAIITASGALGCSSDDSQSAGNVDAGGGAAGSSSTGGSSGSGGSGGRNGTGGASGSGGVEGGTDAQGGSGGVAPIYPVALGYSWTYDVTPLGLGDSCGSGARTTTVVGQSLLAGRNAFELDYFCSDTPVYVSTAGDQLYYYTSNAWQLALDTPVAEGHSWPFFDGTRTWHSVGTVTVAAGTFTDCWDVDQQGAGVTTASFTYCRGVGLVRLHGQSQTGDGSDAALVSTSF